MAFFPELRRHRHEDFRLDHLERLERIEHFFRSRFFFLGCAQGTPRAEGEEPSDIPTTARRASDRLFRRLS
jgi:hypothetical protein